MGSVEALLPPYSTQVKECEWRGPGLGPCGHSGAAAPRQVVDPADVLLSAYSSASELGTPGPAARRGGRLGVRLRDGLRASRLAQSVRGRPNPDFFSADHGYGTSRALGCGTWQPPESPALILSSASLCAPGRVLGAGGLPWHVAQLMAVPPCQGR